MTALLVAATFDVAHAQSLVAGAGGSVRVVSSRTVSGPGSSLVVDGAPRVRSWVSFRAPFVPAKATLRLYITGGGRWTRADVRAVSKKRLDAALRRLGPSGTPRLGRTPTSRSKRWVSIDVTEGVRRTGSVVFVLSTLAERERHFAGPRSAHAPRLVLRRSGAGGTTVAAPVSGGTATPGPGGGTSAPGGSIPNPPAQPTPPPLPAPSMFLSPSGNDAGGCSQSAPCRTLDYAYRTAAPGTVVEVAGGSYGSQTIRTDPAKAGAGCVSKTLVAACVVFQPAAGATVNVGNLVFGSNYKVAGPAGIMIAADTTSRRFTTSGTDFNQAREVGTWGVVQPTMYIAGGQDVAIRGGEVGPLNSGGTHPEVQRVYGSSPLIVPQNLTIEGVYFHDINTTSPTAHVDCLQVENGTGIVIRGNRFERCGSVGLRMSFGSDSSAGPPTNVLIENNVFGDCANIPVSQCYFSAQPGVGVNVLVRYNTSKQEFQPTGASSDGKNVSFVGNLAQGIGCESYVTYSHNVWQNGKCGSTDRKVTTLGLVNPAGGDYGLLPTSPAIDAGDPASYPATDYAGKSRPVGAAPDAGAIEAPPKG